MAKVSNKQEQVNKVFQTVSFMNYQPGQDYDYYYPSIDDLNKLGTVNKKGVIVYDETELAFLVWLLRPIDPDSVTPAQKKIMEYATQLLNDYITEFSVEESDEEQQAKLAIMQKYAAKHKKAQKK